MLRQCRLNQKENNNNHRAAKHGPSVKNGNVKSVRVKFFNILFPCWNEATAKNDRVRNEEAKGKKENEEGQNGQNERFEEERRGRVVN